jgi:hypothetical protein
MEDNKDVLESIRKDAIELSKDLPLHERTDVESVLYSISYGT